MSSDLLIPFAWSKMQNKIVAADEVAKGINCQCICLSCKQQLISRQGEINQAHFAHLKVQTSSNNSLCKFSIYRSIKAMLCQLLDEGISIKLPKWELAKYNDTLYMSEENVSVILVTRESTVTLSDIQRNISIENVRVDVFGNVKDYRFAVFFEYPQRRCPEVKANILPKDVGFVSIDITHIPALLSEKRFSIRDLLIGYLSNQMQSKKWIGHPRYETALSNVNSPNLTIDKPSTEGSEIRECIYTGIQVKCFYGKTPECPKCGGHLCLSSNLTMRLE